MGGRQTCVLVALIAVAFTLQEVQTAQGRPLETRQSSLHRHRRSLRDDSSLTAHECLWNAPKADEGSAGAVSSATAIGSTAQAVATATASASAFASATATSSAVATATAGAVVPKPRAQCSLNPSYFFSLPSPVVNGERLLLELTAMRYGCLNHTSFATCAVDQANWCTWHEDTNRCEMSYDDADFVHLLLWSRTRIACSGSKLEQVVTCSYITLDTDCTGNCAWADGACYPAWYAPLVSRPQSIQFFKRQVFTGDPEVWGSCAGADLYRTYSSNCNYGQDQCMQDAQCQWIADFETQVMSNPLNFTKPCLLSTTKISIESVFLSFNSDFSTAVISAQQECIRSRTESGCTGKQVTLAPNVLDGAFGYKASDAPGTGPAPSIGTGGDTFQISDNSQLPPLGGPQESPSDQMISAAEGDMHLNINPSKLGQAGVDQSGRPMWYIHPCTSPEACSSAFSALGRLHVITKPMIGGDVLSQPLAAPSA